MWHAYTCGTLKFLKIFCWPSYDLNLRPLPQAKYPKLLIAVINWTDINNGQNCLRWAMRVKYWKSCQFWQCFMQDSLHRRLTGKCLGFIIKPKQTILCYQHCRIPWCIAVEVLLGVCGWRVEGDVVLHTSVRVQQHTAKQHNSNGDVTHGHRWHPGSIRHYLASQTPVPSHRLVWCRQVSVTCSSQVQSDVLLSHISHGPSDSSPLNGDRV